MFGGIGEDFNSVRRSSIFERTDVTSQDRTITNRVSEELEIQNRINESIVPQHHTFTNDTNAFSTIKLLTKNIWFNFCIKLCFII